MGSKETRVFEMKESSETRRQTHNENERGMRKGRREDSSELINGTVDERLVLTSDTQ